MSLGANPVHKYESLVLKALSEKNGIGLDDLVSLSGIGKDEAMWALENLKSRGMVKVDYSETERVSISDEGKAYVKEGLPEEQLIKRLSEGEIAVADLIDEKSRIGLQWAKKEGLVQITAGMLKLTNEGRKAAESGTKDGGFLRHLAANISDTSYLHKNRESLLNLVKRKLVQIERAKSIEKISATNEAMVEPRYSSSDLIDKVDRSIISTEAWKKSGFKKYDVGIKIESRFPAVRSPIKRIIEQMKDAYVSMGFQEVSGPAVETSFWNFDSLFVPQDHPARDMQDTFYVSNPEPTDTEPLPYSNRVRKAHEQSWHTKWSEDISRQLVLRTHTTSVSSRYAYKIINDISKGQGDYQLPVRLFSIGRVFRNEAIDYKHLADLYQMDGLIIGKDLTMSNLFDTLKKIYDYTGIEIRFRPSYFPFVEPGAEYQARLKDRDEWIEMGGAGLLREEITGVRRTKISALAWGAGLERILLVKDPTLTSITELYNNGLGWLRKRRLV